MYQLLPTDKTARMRNKKTDGFLTKQVKGRGADNLTSIVKLYKDFKLRQIPPITYFGVHGGVLELHV